MAIDTAYAPIVKGKLNDIKAVSHLSRSVAARTKPIFELPPFQDEDDSEAVLRKFVDRLAKHYAERGCYVDFPLLKAGARISSGSPVLQAAFDMLEAQAIRFEPVYGFDRDESLWPVVLTQAEKCGGFLLRLDPDDIHFPGDTLDQIQELTLRGLNTARMDVLLDCRFLSSPAATAAIGEASAEFLEHLATSFNVRRTIVAGSSAPKSVGNIKPNSLGEVLRNELALWTNLRVRGLHLEPIYSDYGVVNPDFTDLIPTPNINGKIRHTHGKHFKIFRGHSLRKEDCYEQYRKLSREVMDSGFFQGHGYSFGDRYIYDCASGLVSTGNAGTWVLNDQNHHFTYATQQVLRLEPFVHRGYPEAAILELA